MQKRVQIHVAQEVQSIAVIADEGQVVERPGKPPRPASQTTWPYQENTKHERKLLEENCLRRRKEEDRRKIHE